MNSNKNEFKMSGATLTFVILQLCYLFFFFIRFPDSFRNAVGSHYGALDALANWISTLTMLAYCILCLAAVTQLVMRKHGFLLWFQISDLIALIGNFAVFILMQFAGESYSMFSYYAGDYYWVLFIMALFWTVIWCMYFARSSRVYSYMGEDATYLRRAFFTKNVKEPTPWQEPKPIYPMYGPQYPPPAGPNPSMQAPVPAAPTYPAYPPQPMQPPPSAPPLYQPPVATQPPVEAPLQYGYPGPEMPPEPPVYGAGNAGENGYTRTTPASPEEQNNYFPGQQ